MKNGLNIINSNIIVYPTISNENLNKKEKMNIVKQQKTN